MVNYFDRKSVAVIEQHSAPRVLEGKEIIDTVCPINPLTGKRSSVLEALLSVSSDPKKKYLLGQILQELPTIRNNPNLTDEDRIMTLAERLSTGTPSEDVAFGERLSEISSVIFRGAPQAVKDVVKSLEKSEAAPASEAASVSD